MYQAKWTPWWTVQPEMQYVIRPGRWRPQQRRRLAAKRVGDCTSVHNQFLNRPHQANKFKTCCHIARLSKADEAIGCVVPVALGQIAPAYRPRCDHTAISAPPSDISSNSAKNTAILDSHQIELVASSGTGTDMETSVESERKAHAPNPTADDPFVRRCRGRHDPFPVDAAGYCRARNPHRQASPDCRHQNPRRQRQTGTSIRPDRAERKTWHHALGRRALSRRSCE